MPPITTRLERGWMLAREHLPLAAVPLLTALLATDRIVRILSHRGGHVGLRAGLPATVVDVWTFVSVPSDGVELWLGVPGGLPFALVGVPLAVVLRAVLSAGYFGAIRGSLESGEYRFAPNARRHFVPFLLYTLLPTLALVPLVAVEETGSLQALGPLLVLALPAVLILSYLFYATPYLIVLREVGLVPAARASYGFAVDGGPYARYAVGFAGFVLALSLVLSLVVVNLGPVGVVLGVGIGAPLGLACNAATMQFVADVDPESPSLGDAGDVTGTSTGEPVDGQP